MNACLKLLRIYDTRGSTPTSRTNPSETVGTTRQRPPRGRQPVLLSTLNESKCHYLRPRACYIARASQTLSSLSPWSTKQRNKRPNGFTPDLAVPIDLYAQVVVLVVMIIPLSSIFFFCTQNKTTAGGAVVAQHLVSICNVAVVARHSPYSRNAQNVAHVLRYR